MFLGGRLSYHDEGFLAEYEMVPYGLSAEIVRKDRLPTIDQWYPAAMRSWSSIDHILLPLPDTTKYTQETWEWTIGRDWLDHVLETSAYFLELVLANLTIATGARCTTYPHAAQCRQAIAAEHSQAHYLSLACYFLESGVALEQRNASAGALKNLGLAHLHLVKSELPDDAPLPLPPDVLRTIRGKAISWPDGARWKNWCSVRFVHAWGAFLAHKDANSDPQFTSIQKMYTSVLKSTTKPHPTLGATLVPPA